jgi:dipeptidyl-peptidase 4
MQEKLQLTQEDYARAERMLPWNLKKLVGNAEIKPTWLENGERFWYLCSGPQGKRFVLVDPELGEQAAAFNHDRLASELSKASGKPCTGNQLPFETIEWIEGDRALSFTAYEKAWIYNLEKGSLTENPAEPAPQFFEVLSPDKKWAAFSREYNLWVRNLESKEEIQLTQGGEYQNNYGATPEGNTMWISTKLMTGGNIPPMLAWSQDSKKILTQKIDQRKVKELHLLQYAPEGSSRPVLHTYRYPMPGDELAKGEIYILDMEKRSSIKADLPAIEIDFMGPLELKMLWWDEDSKKGYCTLSNRGHKILTFWEIDAESGQTRNLLEETGNTFVEPGPNIGMVPNIKVFGKQFLWWSERDGWEHLYRYNLETGELINQVTSGSFYVYDIKHVDEEGGWVYLRAGGREAGRDPYYWHLYRARLDGSELQLLTPEDAIHEVTFSKSGKYFVDTFSRVDLPPVTVLRACDGSLVKKLEEADISELQKTGWSAPQPFTVKALDGVTDLYGVIYLPYHFDPERSYPVIESIYPGPQAICTQKGFIPRGIDKCFTELGFITVTIEGQGNCWRNKANHDMSYGKLDTGGDLENHIHGIRQLARRFPCMDLTRVGIHGHSGGGFASTRAILKFPDFYKVAVSSAGNHDQRGYIAGWGEIYNGLLEGDNYAAQANISLAGNLKGKLLLVTGDMDDNVLPALTIQVANALIKANKDFDFLILPNTNHGTSWLNAYFLRRLWDYFVRNLAGNEPPKEYAIDASAFPSLNIV